MLRQELDRALDRVARRVRLWRGIWLGAAVWIVAGAAGLITARLAAHDGALAMAVAAAVFAVCACAAFVVARRPVARRPLARRIERAFPDLDGSLLTALEQHPDVLSGELSYFQREVLYVVLAHARRFDWRRVVTAASLASAMTTHLVAAVVTLVVLGPLMFAGVGTGRSSGPPVASLNGAVRDDVDPLLAVEPGDATIERGTALPVIARFGDRVPASARLIVRDAAGAEATTELARNLNDPVFGGRLAEVSRPLTYRIEYDTGSRGRRSRDFNIEVFDLPGVERFDVVVTPPAWAKLPDVEMKDVRRISVVEGSQFTLKPRLNKPVSRFTLSAGGQELSRYEMSFSTSNVQTEKLKSQQAIRVDRIFPLRSETLKIELVDFEGRRNRDPIELTLEVVPNCRPRFRTMFPGRDVRVSPIEELTIEGTVWDDFGLVEAGVLCTWGGKPPQAIPLRTELAGRETHALRRLVEVETIGPKPGDILAYCLYADDHGPDGRVRRTFGDLFFAEVRPFEELFREGQSPPGGGGAPGGSQNPELEQFVQQQKQILQATWKLSREPESGPIDLERPHEDVVVVPNVANEEPLMKRRAEEITTIRESQQALVAPVKAFGDKVRDPRQQSAVKAALEEMTAAAERLDSARKLPHPRLPEHAETLARALASEQAALQALMRLRAREHQVARASGGGGGGGGASQQQLEQLELNSEQNRYQTNSQAKAPQEASRREQLQALNRLRELARRQADVNDKLRDLDPKLARADDAAAEAKRQLKKLRDEQEQLLRDVDELRSRMDRPENQQEMSDARKKLDDVRDRVQQASEAMTNGQTSKSLSAGAKAEKSLSDLRDDLRRRTSSQFADAVRDLRQEARELAERQQQVGKQLDEAQRPPSSTTSSAPSTKKSLRRDDPAPKLSAALAEQKERVDRLMDDVRRTVEQSEASEPLLAKQLYEAARAAREQAPSENLQKASQLAGQNRSAEAAKHERPARDGIDRLRAGIDKAADSVLGDESEALRRARDELADLGDAVRKAFDKQGAKPSDALPPRPKEPGDDGAGHERKPFQTADASDPTGRSSRSGASPRGKETADAGSGSDKAATSRSSLANNPMPDSSSDSPLAGSSSSNKPGQGESSGSGEGGRSGDASRNSDGKPDSRSSKGSSGKSPGNANGETSGDSPSGGSPSESGSPANGGSSRSDAGESRVARNGRESRGPQRGTSQGRGSSSTSSSSGRSAGGPGEGDEAGAGASSPITGDGFGEWSDRLRDVEEMLTDDRMKAEAARIRDRAKSLRAEFKRHATEPNRDLLRTTVLEPLAELQRLVAADLARRESKESLAPVDRDRAPEKYNDLVRRYYERLGQPERTADSGVEK